DSGSEMSNDDVDGGAIYNVGNLSLKTCTISNCLAATGGAIYNDGNSFLINCVIEACANDSGQGDGAGIYNHSGNFTLVACVVTGCDAGWWGGGIASWGNLTMTNTTIADNTSEEGGGLYLGGGTNLFSNCTIRGNASYQYGGGGLKNLGQLTLLNCTVSGNSCPYVISADGGGGIENLNLLTMLNCTVSGNSCSAPHGGGILNTTVNWDNHTFPGASIQLTSCTIVSNTATGTANTGGLENINGGSVHAQTTLFAGNDVNDISGVLTSQGYNLIQNPGSSTMAGDLTGNLYGLDPLLGPLQSNGGPTFTHALLTNSPAIDAGPTNAPAGFDQRGMSRPQGLALDIGAFEFGASPAVVSTILSILHTGNGCLQVKFAGASDCNYTLQRAPSPSGPWTAVTPVTSNSDGCGVCLDSHPPAGSAFYRTAFP
ncbi:MAG: hypothetical protein JWR69_982, partial [Pedosphaera sp.]|nr:hypothetical protein [Pedosphaera sp.]